MEMEESALRHIMDVQTQMLQTLTRLQEEQLRNQANTTLTSGNASSIQDPTASITSSTETLQQPLEMTPDGHYQTQKPTYIASPDTTTISSSAMPLGPMAVSDPTSYGTIANPGFNGGRRQDESKTQGNFFNRGLVGGAVAEMRDFDPTRQSKEATSEFISSQARGLQEKAVGVVGGVATGVTSAASLLIPGLIPGLVVGGAAAVGVGGATNAIVEGATTALDYQDILQREDYKFINAFESTDDMGGIGMGLEQRQEVSGFLRDLADEEFLDDPDMMQILEGASQNNLLKSVRDVKSFKEKFSQVVDAVKEISVTMNASLEEATAFMGELERRGISTTDAPMIAAQTKVMSSMLGISTQEGSQLLLNTSDAVVQGTGISAGDVIQSTAENTYFAQALQDQAAETGNEALYNYSKNMGGAGAGGAMFEQIGRNFIRSEQGTNNLVGLFGSAFELNEEGGFTLNESAMSELMNSDLSNQELQEQSRNFTSTLEATQLAKLQGTAGELFSASADSYDMSQFLRRNIQVVQDAQPGIDDETALIEGLGVAEDYAQAEYITSMIDVGNDEDARDMLQARTLKEEMDSNAIADSPSLMTRIKFGIERNITNPLGDVGQNVADTLGTGLEDYQKWITGIDSRSMVGGTPLADFDQGGLSDVIKGLDVTARAQTNIAQDMRDRADETNNPFESIRLSVGAYDIESGLADPDDLQKLVDQDASEFTGGMLNSYMARINKGTMGAAEIGELAHQSEDMAFVERNRAELAVEAATGEFDTIGGKMDYGIRRTGIEIAAGGRWIKDNTYGKVKGWITGESARPDVEGTDMTQRSLEKSREELMDVREDLGEEVMSLFAGDELESLNEDELKQLEKAIEAGDTDTVESLTDSSEAQRLAGEYQTLTGNEGEFKEGMQGYNDLKRYTKGVATVGTQLGDLLKTAGVYDEAEIDDLLGDVIDKGNKTNKKLGKGKMTTEKMIESSAEIEAELDQFFKNGLDDGSAQMLAENMVARDASAAEQIFKEGTTEVDTEALQSYVMDQLRNQHITDPDKEGSDGKTDKAKEAKNAAKEHEEAMSYYLSSMQNETEMIWDAIEGRAVPNNKNSTLTTR